MPKNTKPLITIDSLPDVSKDECTISLNISWELAEKIATFAAPFLASVQGSVDCRTQNQIKRDEQDLKRAIEFKKKNKKRLLCVYRNLKKIHKNKLTYSEFCRNLDSDTGEYTFIFLKDSNRRMLYKRIKIWSIQLLFKKGHKVPEISSMYGIKKSLVYNYKNTNRRKIKYTPS